MLKPYKHIQDILTKKHAKRLFALGTGGAKTSLALLSARGDTLVLCPKTQAEDRTWERELRQPHVTKKVDPDLKLTVISKEQFKKQADTLPSYDTVIIDECHQFSGMSPATYQRKYIKYPKTSQIYTAVHSYLARNSPKRLYLLTATPTPTPMTFYGIASLLGYKWSFFKYRDIFYWEWKRNIYCVTNTEECKKKLAVLVNQIGEVGRLQDWFDVPDQTYRVEHVGTTAEQRKTFLDLRLVYPDPLVQLGKRHQLEQGIYEGGRIKENKTKAIEQYAKEFDQLIVFCRYTAQIEHYATQFGAYTLTGKTKDRGSMLAKLRLSDKYILIVQSAISLGWELPECPCMIFASEDFAFTDRIQAEGRILRANHLKKNLYVTLLAGEADKKVRGVMEQKEDFVEHIFAKSLSSNNKL